MEKCIPQGQYDLSIIMPGKYLRTIQDSLLLAEHGIFTGELYVIDAVKPYIEIELEDANIQEVVNEMIQKNIEADIEVRPSVNENMQIDHGFKAYTRHTNEGTVSYVNSIKEDDIAYELTMALNELNEKGIHEADEVLLKRINQSHSIGWVY